MAITFDPKKILFESDTTSFLKLGEHAAEAKLSLSKFKLAKYQKIEEIWGTLGWAKDRKLEVRGKITLSRTGGGDSYAGITKEIAQLLVAQNVEIAKISQIKQRFIDLNDVVFKDDPK
jgi:hypothetical protein